MAIPRTPNSIIQEFFRLEMDCPPPGSGTLASGLITCVSNANMADSDYITVGDGINPAILFEYDKSANGVTSGRTAVTAGASTAADVAAQFAAAIAAALPALTVTDNLNGTVTLTAKVAGAVGNVTITENVANAGFLVSGMSSGTANGELGATKTIKAITTQRRFRVDKVEYISPTGFVQDASNYWTIALKKGSTSMAAWSTQTSAQGTIAANTFVNLVLDATDANRVAAVSDVISIVFTKAASAANLPAGRFVAHCRYV